MTDRDLIDALEECLERLLHGTTLEECLRRYPDHVAELRPLLELATSLADEEMGRLSPEARARSKERFQGAVRFHLQRQRPSGSWWSSAWLRPWAPAAVAFLLFLGLGGGSVVASADSMPGQPLYPVMRVAERAQLALTRSPQAEARLRLTLVDRRVREITFLARAGRTQDVDRLQQEVGREIEMAQASLGLPAGVAVAATPAGREMESEADSGLDESAPSLAPEKSLSAPALAPAPEAELSSEHQAVLEGMREQATHNLAMLELRRAQAEPEMRRILDHVIRQTNESYTSALRRFAANEILSIVPGDRLVVIEAVVQGPSGRWTIAGRPLVPWRDSALRRRLAAGQPVRVEGVLEPGGGVRIVAVKLLERRPNVPEGAVLVAGPVTAVSGEDRAIVGGFRVLLTPETQSDGTAMRLGAWAWITGILAPDGTIRAASVRVVAEGR